MDDLISRKAVQEALCADTEEGTFTFTEDQAEAADKIIRYVVKTLRSVPSVPAVPLDKLCEWLAAENVTVPCNLCDYFKGGKCSVINDAKMPCPAGTDEWRKAMGKGMEVET